MRVRVFIRNTSMDENQYPPPFPYDAFELSDDIGSDLRAPASAATGDERALLAAIHRKLQDLDQQLHALLILFDRDAMGMPMPPSTFRTESRDHERPRAMPNPRPSDPLTVSTLPADGDALRVIEGVFDGQNMVGPDGKHYSVPANYASKSKLVEGDILKLTITARGAFVYKQIGPIARERTIGALERDDVTGEFVVLVADNEDDRGTLARAVSGRTDLPAVPYKRYRVLRASITFYRGSPGDEAVLLVPQGAPSTWAAVENVIKR